MTSSVETSAELKDFSGLAPLFPLPNVVLFPHALLPLQIFEPRYRQMTADVLEGERLIAMSLLRPGWQYFAQDDAPPIHHMVGLGKVIAYEKLDDGRFYLVLRGLARAKLISEQVVDLPYRIGHLEICSDQGDMPSEFDAQVRAEELVRRFAQLFPGTTVQKLFVQAIEEVPLATVCDVLLGSLTMASELSQQFLDELSVETRSRMLLDLLQGAIDHSGNVLGRAFPPDFSSN